MRENKFSSPESQSIAREISGLLQDGYVLTIADLNEIGAKYTLTTRFITKYLWKFGEFLEKIDRDQERYKIANTDILRVRYGNHFLLRSATLPLEETEWDRVTSEITTKMQRAITDGIHGGRLK